MTNLEPITIDGRIGTVAYLNADFELVDPEQATLAKVVFDDGMRTFYQVTGLKAAGGPGSGRYPKGSGGFGLSSVYDIAESKHLHDAMLNTAKEQAGYVGNRLNRLELASNQMRGAVKQAIVEQLSERMGVTNSPVVQEKLDVWAQTSGDSDPRAIQMQNTVNVEFELQNAGVEHMQPKSLISGPIEDFLVRRGEPSAEDVALSQNITMGNRQYLRAEYANTQAWFKKNGITRVSVYRGMAVDKTIPTNTEAEVEMQPASSWSTSKLTAVNFASSNEFREPNKRGMILSASIPVERVLSTAVTGRGALTESEILVLGGKMRVKVGN